MMKSSCNSRCKAIAKKDLLQLRRQIEAPEKHRRQDVKQPTQLPRPKLEDAQRRAPRTKTFPQRSSIPSKLPSQSQNLHRRERRYRRERSISHEVLEVHMLRSFLLLCPPHNHPSLPSLLNYLPNRWLISQRRSMIDREPPIVSLRS